MRGAGCVVPPAWSSESVASARRSADCTVQTTVRPSGETSGSAARAPRVRRRARPPSWRDGIQIGLQADVRSELHLIEDEPPAGRRDLPAQVFRRHLARRRAVARQLHQSREPVRVRDRVEEPSGIAESGRAHREPMTGPPCRDRLVRLRLLLCGGVEVVPQRAERSPEHFSKRRRAEVGDPPRRFLGEADERLGTEPIGEVLMEVGAVGVLRRPAGPVDQAAVRAIDRIEPSGRGRAIDDHAEVAGRHASFTRQRALVVRRDAFNLPEREKQIRKEHRGPAEHAREGRRSTRGPCRGARCACTRARTPGGASRRCSQSSCRPTARQR